jgi:uncharacterized membrane protein YdjX (TVP38/TMEM64 family)
MKETPLADKERHENPLYEQYTTTESGQDERPPLMQLIVTLGGLIVFVTVVTFLMNWIGIPELQRVIEEAGAFAPLAYIVLKTLTYVFAPLTSGPIQVVAGTLFGSVWLGVLYTLIGEVIGGSISFWLARRFGRPMVAKLVGRDGMAQVDDFVQNKLGGWQSLAIARVVLFSLWDFISYAVGLTKIKYVHYFWVSTLLGAIPTFLFVWLGDATLNDESSVLWIYVLVGVLIAVPIFFRKHIGELLERNKPTQTPEGEV